MTKKTYSAVGASASKSGLHSALKEAGLEDTSGLFARVSPDFAGDPAYYSVLHCDGAGTKSLVAYLMAQESGDLGHYAGLAQDALVMNLDDMFCLGAPESLVLSNTIGRNASVISDDVIGVLVAGYTNTCRKLEEHNVHIDLAGGETADCGDLIRTLLVDAVIAGRIAKKSLIHPQNIIPGDKIVGLSSSGQASYEDRPNSSIGSNGLTLARHCLLKPDYKERYPEVADPSLANNISYSGKFSLEDSPEGLGMSVGEALLSPTRTYAPVLKALYQTDVDVHGVIHNTGGGQTKVLRFGTGNTYVKNNLFPTPPLFSLIQKENDIDWKEMYQVFNMGHRMEIYIEESDVETVLSLAKSYLIEAQVVGHVEKNKRSSSNAVRIESPEGTFHYTL